MFKVAHFSFDGHSIRKGDMIQSAPLDSRQISMTIPSIKQDVELVGEARRVGCIAQFPSHINVKNISEIREIPIHRPIDSVAIHLVNPNEVSCEPTIGGGGLLKYRWWINGVPMSGGELTDSQSIPATQRSKYECEIVQRRGNKVISETKSALFIHGQTPLNMILYDMNVTALRAFSNSAEFYVERAPTSDVVLPADAILPPAELRVSIQRDGNEQQYHATIWINGDWQLFNISDLMPGSTYNFSFWSKAKTPAEMEAHGHSEYWQKLTTIVISTANSPLAIAKLRPEETAIIIILCTVTVALFLLFCNIFICIKIRRKRQLLAAAKHAVNNGRTCCFLSDGFSDGKHETSNTTPPASEAESGPTSVDMLTPKAVSCSSSSSNGSANALYLAHSERADTLRSKTGASNKRKPSDIAHVVQGLFRPDSRSNKSKYNTHVNVEPPSSSIYRDLFGTDVSVSPVMPNLEYLDTREPAYSEEVINTYRSHPPAIYSIPTPIQYHHVGGKEKDLLNLMSVPDSYRPENAGKSQLPLELQGDLV